VAKGLGDGELGKEDLNGVKVVSGMMLVAATFPEPTNTLTLTC